MLFKQNTAKVVTFLMVSSTDHISGKTGLSAGMTIYATKSGAAPAAITPTIAEMDSVNCPGLYSMSLTATHLNTLGDLALHITAAGSDPLDVQHQVVAINLEDANALGLAYLDAQVSTRLATTGYTAPDNADIITILADVAPAIGNLGTSVAAIKTQTDKMAFTVAGKIDANTLLLSGTAQTAADLGAVATGIKTQTDKMVFSVTNQVDVNVKSVNGTAQTAADHGAQLNTLQTAVTAVKAKTDSLTFTVAGQVDGNVKSVAGTAQTASDEGAQLSTLSTAITAIKAKTDSLTFTVAGVVDANSKYVSGTAQTAKDLGASITQTGDAFARLGVNGAGLTALGDARVANLDAAVSTRLATTGYTAPDNTHIQSTFTLVNSNLDAAISSRLSAATYSAPNNTAIAAIQAKTNNLPTAPADESLIIAATQALSTQISAIPTSAAPTPQQNADAMLDEANGVEAGLTVRQSLRLTTSVLLGKASGLAGTNATFRDVNDTKNRVSATVDANGNRTAVTLDPT